MTNKDKLQDIDNYLTIAYNDPSCDTRYGRIGYNSMIRNEIEYGDFTLCEGEYKKTNLKSDDFDGGIYLINEPINYTYSIYETLIDSNGRSHYVQVGYEDRKIKLEDHHFYIHSRDEGDWVMENECCPIRVDHLYFQFNLKMYALIYNARGFSHLNYARNILDGKFNERPWHEIERPRGLQEAAENSGYYPFYECCYHGEYNYIPEKIFFNYPNRKKAMERILTVRYGSYYKNPTFDEVDYINMTDLELVKFMNDRFKKRLKYEEYLNTKHHFSFSN